VAPGAKIRTDSGEKRPDHDGRRSAWLATTPKLADGRIRALASRYVPGKVVGQFRFTGTRSDDANDIYPHERRRELRGMRVFAAWLNHDDARSINSIDTYVRGRAPLHPALPAGLRLESRQRQHSAQQPRGGNEYLIEGDKWAKGLAPSASSAAIGKACDTRQSVARQHRGGVLPAVEVEDRVSAAGVRPDGRRDAFWAASLASRFTNR
jgi:hypothetical protein